ncbi:GAF domain-containing protein [Mycolicibacterium stellerae]|uniref:GAF domain-containing protein n=1 Tax=Mycolicibacterium stellerae TaxID=2358193 RepID=UPI000F0B3C03|nr:helix-turn-helix domain-containing protein [Mycolicibacterium stellerae]
MVTSRSRGGRATARLPNLRALHDLFVAGQVDDTYLDSTSLRPVVAASWRRSRATGVDPDIGAAHAASIAVALDEMRSAHPLASALPVIRRLLIEDASDAGVVVAVSAADGTLLWVEGDREARRKAEAMNFVPGADWSESGAGTNAPGTALALDTELQIRGCEHFSRIVAPWNCAAAPVHDPISGALIGAIDLTGGPDVASPQTLALLRATGVAIENHLALLHLRRPAVAEPAGGARLSVLGADRPQWRATDADGNPHTTTLTSRHADILVLLSRHPEGLSADHLAMLLDDNDLDTVTVRAEVSRLRRVIGAEFVASRPYRLLTPIRTDMDDVADALDAGDVDRAVSGYAGALLPKSVSPGVARMRTELSASLRAAVLASGDFRLLRRWLDSPEGRDDRDGWRILHDKTAPGSVMRAQASGHLAGLDFDLA